MCETTSTASTYYAHAHRYRMYCYGVFLTFLWYTASSQAVCPNVTICAASGSREEPECPHAALRLQLSDLTANETSCSGVHIYLTSGTHILRRNITFADSVEVTVIQGIVDSQPAIIECWNHTGITFSENATHNKVSLSNTVLSHCRTTARDFSQAAIYFRNAVYSLFNVAVVNTMGYGLYADQCKENDVFNCTFRKNSDGHIQVVIREASIRATVVINETNLWEGDSGGIHVSLSEGVSSKISIEGCEFHGNKMTHLLITSSNSTHLEVANSVFTAGKDDGMHIVSRYQLTAIIRNCTFSRNEKKGLLMDNISKADISNCLFKENSDGVRVNMPEGTKCTTKNNTASGSYATTIRNCTFVANKVSRASAVLEIRKGGMEGDAILLEHSSFKRNYGINLDCSALLIVNNYHVTLSNVTITDNICTGVTLYDSKIMLENAINLMRNRGLLGGAISLKGSDKSNSMVSTFTFTRTSNLNIVNNSAKYGGGVHSEGRCGATVHPCFFLLDKDYTATNTALTFSGNSGRKGGDAVFGGCLSGCYIDIRGERITLNRTDHNNEFWNLVSSEDNQSLSMFVEEPKRAAFCIKNTTTDEVSYSVNSYTVSAYRGETFTIPLTAIDDFCTPLVERIEAEVLHEEDALVLNVVHEQEEAREYCHNFSYALRGGATLKTVNISFSIENQLPSHTTAMVHLRDCPAGYEIDTKLGTCVCLGILRLYKIECNLSAYSLEVPALTWLGEVREGSGSIGVQIDCQYCKNEGTQTIRNIKLDSDELCIASRAGVLCGACIEGYSLQLGWYKCADCSNSTYTGVLLMLAILSTGIILILILLCLDLTVSSGIINALIFYSNIVYLNRDPLLPIATGNTTPLQNTLRLLSTFQALVNLDSATTTCFYDGYDLYTSNWLQFVFPLYIWLLILIIVLSSRYSKRVSKYTSSNIVPVLATLMLLAYAKLLRTVIASLTSVRPQLLSGEYYPRLWSQDANIAYLSPLHLPLFLMGLAMLLVYIIPFTLLILLGPLVQAKSHYRLLNWINRLKPFLDAFYGPYNSQFRYWPGLLLLARLFTFVTPNDTQFKLMTISIMVALLFVIWMVIGKTNAASLHRKTALNYIELFFLLNLEVFVTISIYIAQLPENNIAYQQGLTVAMVGSALVVSCGLLACQIFSRLRAVRARARSVGAKFGRNARDSTRSQDLVQESGCTLSKTTHNVVEIKKGAVHCQDLREPLLED